jgi:TIR domain
VKPRDTTSARTAPPRTDTPMSAVGTGKIFLSYRRDDSAPTAGRIYDRLTANFDKDAVFKDVDSIPYGVNFPKHIAGMIQQCAVLLAIIGPGWLEARDSSGQRRLDDPADSVRVEIEAGLERGIAVIPVLVQGAPVPEKDQLPPSLSELPDLNAVFVRNDPDFNTDMYRLETTIKRLIGDYEREQARLRAEAEAEKRRQEVEAERIRRETVAQEHARKRAERRQAMAGAVSSLNKPGGRGALLLVALLVLAFALVLSPAGSALTHIGRPNVTPTHTLSTAGSASPTVDRDATAAVVAMQTIAAGQTATANAFLLQPYVAARPGPCDTNSSWWQVDRSRSGTVTCTATGTLFTGDAVASFFGPAGGRFPSDFTVSLDVVSWSGRAGPNLGRASAPQPVGGAFGIGLSSAYPTTWYVIYGSSASGHASGDVQASSKYTLTIGVQHGVETFLINGTQVDQIQLTSDFLRTTSIFFGQGDQTPADASSELQNFRITPLS